MVGDLAVPKMLDRCAIERGDTPAITLIDGETLTYEAWRAASCQLARAARTLSGVQLGDRVLISGDARSWPEYAIAYVGVQRAGAVPVPVARASGARHMERIVESGEIAACVQDHALGLPCVQGEGIDAFPADSFDLSNASPLAEAYYTSGPDGALTRADVRYEDWPVATNSDADSAPEVILHASSPGTRYGRALLASVLSAAPCRMIVMPRFDPRLVVDAIDVLSVTALALVPSTARTLIAALEDGIVKGEVGRLQSVWIGGAPLAAADLARLETAFPRARIVDTHSSIERAVDVSPSRAGIDEPHLNVDGSRITALVRGIWQRQRPGCEITDQTDLFEDLGVSSHVAALVVDDVRAVAAEGLPLQTVYEHPNFGDFVQAVASWCERGGGRHVVTRGRDNR